MSEQRARDDLSLIDFLLGRCEADERPGIQARLQHDHGFQKRHDDLSHAFAALSLLPAAEPPENLLDRTSARIASARRTEALIAREEMARAPLRPTFAFREVAVAAAAVLVLAVIFLPSLRQARSAARIQECASQVGRIGTGLLTYANSNGGALPGVVASRHWLPGANDSVSNSAALWKLVQGRYVSSPVLFQCPAVGGNSFEVKAGMTDFPACKYIGYSYQHMMGGRTLHVSDPALAPMSGTMAVLADGSPIFVDGRFQPQRLAARASDNHGGAGQNVLYLDWHVGWASTADAGVDGDNIYLVQGVRKYRGDEVPTEPTDSFLLPSFPAADQ